MIVNFDKLIKTENGRPPNERFGVSRGVPSRTVQWELGSSPPVATSVNPLRLRQAGGTLCVSRGTAQRDSENETRSIKI